MAIVVSKNKSVAVDHNCGVCEQLLTVEEVTELLNGKAVAIEVNDGEYTLFIACDLFFSWEELEKLLTGCAKKWHEEHDRVVDTTQTSVADAPSDEDIKRTITDLFVKELYDRIGRAMGVTIIDDDHRSE